MYVTCQIKCELSFSDQIVESPVKIERVMSYRRQNCQLHGNQSVSLIYFLLSSCFNVFSDQRSSASKFYLRMAGSARIP